MKKMAFRILILILSIIISNMVNTIVIDSLLDIFKIMSLVPLLLNRVALALFIYFLLEMIFLTKKFQLKDIINKLFLIYLIWLIGILFGRFANKSNYNVATHFNFHSYLPEWMHSLNHPLVRYYILGNVLVYIPFGLFLRYYKKIVHSFFYCIGIIFIFETLQGVTNLGYFDIDDLFLNIIGGFLGILLMHLYKKIFIGKHE